MKKKNKEYFVTRAIKKHGLKYDYSNSVYLGAKSPIEIFCKQHGFFKQIASNHLSGMGCQKCGNSKIKEKRAKNTGYFKNRCLKIFGDIFDFQETIYVNRDVPVKVFCKKCNKYFSKSPRYFYEGLGCPHCSLKLRSKNLTHNTSEFIETAKKMHGDNFNYEEVNYVGVNERVAITCNKCGTRFFQKPRYLLQGDGGCPKCWRNKISKRHGFSKEEFVEKAIEVHGREKYDYSFLTDLSGSKTKVKILCKKCNKFFFQRKDWHLKGNGCSCYKEYQGEKTISSLLIKKNIQFETNKTFQNCKLSRPLYYDFYIPSYNLLVEYDGIQHFSPVCFGGISKSRAEKLFGIQKIRDCKKTEFAKSNGINLIRFTYENINDIEFLLEDLLKKIDISKPMM